jgi:hypothetical protein
MKRAMLGLLIPLSALVGCASDQKTPETQTRVIEGDATHTTVTVYRDGELQPASRLELATEPDEGMDAEGAGREWREPPGRSSCPMLLTSARVAALPREGDVVLEFVADQREVEQLRRRVEILAAAYDGRSPGAGERALSAPEVRARYEPTPVGARIVVVPASAGELEAVRRQVLSHAEFMARQNECPALADLAD